MTNYSKRDIKVAVSKVQGVFCRLLFSLKNLLPALEEHYDEMKSESTLKI